MKRKLTGKYYFKKRFLGGFNIMVEELVKTACPITGDIDPEYLIYRKAKEQDLKEIGL